MYDFDFDTIIKNKIKEEIEGLKEFIELKLVSMNLISNEFKSENELILEVELAKVIKERDSLRCIVSEIGMAVFKAEIIPRT